MKKVINSLFKFYIYLFKYPCRIHTRLALEKNLNSGTILWRIGMCYTLDLGIKETARAFNLSEKEIIESLNKLVEGIYYE